MYAHSSLPAWKAHPQHSQLANTKGFTLIELVVVIVILGILSAVAAPRFINLSGDANAAALEALGGSLMSTANLYHTKAIINNRFDNSYTVEGVYFDQGYPIGVSFGDSDSVPEILEAMNISDDFVYNTRNQDRNSNNQLARGLYLTNKAPNDAPSTQQIIDTNCYVSYKSAVFDEAPPEVATVTTGC